MKPVCVDFLLDFFVSDEGKHGKQHAEGDKKGAEERRVAVKLNMRRLSLLLQEEGKLLHEQGEAFDNETERHNAYARPDPGKERPFVRHVDATVAGSIQCLFFRTIGHKRNEDAPSRALTDNREVSTQRIETTDIKTF